MKKILLLTDCGGFISPNSLNEGCGGSETWLIQIADEFSKYIDVDICCHCKTSISNNIRWYDLSECENIFKNNKYDAIILSRSFKNYINLSEKYNTTDKIFLQCHDLHINRCGCIIDYNIEKELQSPTLKKIVSLTKFHTSSLQSYNNVPKERIIEIPNGVDLKLFDGIHSSERDNRILISSQYERSADILINRIAPLVKNTIKDFGVDIALPAYSNISNTSFPDYVKYIGHLNKRELYKQMSSHKCWYYPSTFPETFCITSIENAMCENNIVMPIINGPETIFKKFKNDISMKTTIQDNDDFINESVQKIIYNILNYDNMSDIRNKIKTHIIENYTWKNVVERYLQII